MYSCVYKNITPLAGRRLNDYNSFKNLGEHFVGYLCSNPSDFHPRATSRTIMTEKPVMVAMVTKSMLA